MQLSSIPHSTMPESVLVDLEGLLNESRQQGEAVCDESGCRSFASEFDGDRVMFVCAGHASDQGGEVRP